jgi:hypothetical protein
MRVTSTETAIAAAASHVDGSHMLAAHHSAIVTADAHVPEPGCKWPMPKKVAISQERRDLGAVFGDEVIMLGIANIIEKGF